MAKNYFYHGGMLLSEDELMHWKYISKKRVNGKWVYVYDDKKVKEIKRTRQKLLDEQDELRKKSHDLHYDDAGDPIVITEKVSNEEDQLRKQREEIAPKIGDLSDEIMRAGLEKFAATGLNVVTNILSKLKKKK